MRLLGWLTVAVLALDAIGLALVELLYLPLRLPPSSGGLWLPVTVLVAAVGTPLLVLAAAKAAPRPVAAVVPLAAWVLTVVLLGVVGPGGDRVLPADWRSLLLFAAGLVSGGIAVGRSAISEYLPVEPVERRAEVDGG